MMIKTRKELKDFLRFESKLYGNKKICSLIPRFSEQGQIWNYIILLRKYEYCINSNKRIRKVIIKYRFKKKGLKLGFSIEPNVIDRGLLIYHRGNLVLNAKSIGKNFSTAGTGFMVAKGQTSDNPIIKDNVSMGMNATIVGNVTIASGIAIGAGSVVTKSFFEEDVTIAGNPAKIIKHNAGSKSWGGWQKTFGKINQQN